MYCPNQQCPDLPSTGVPSEYRDDVSVCPSCGSELVVSVPSWAMPLTEDGAWVACMTVTDAALLLQMKGILSTAGVQHFVKNETLQNLIGWGTVGLGFNNIFGPPVVMVPPDQLELARQLLKRLDTHTESARVSNPMQGSAIAEEPPCCPHRRKELKAERGDEPLTHCYHCGWPLFSA